MWCPLEDVRLRPVGRAPASGRRAQAPSCARASRSCAPASSARETAAGESDCQYLAAPRALHPRALRSRQQPAGRELSSLRLPLAALRISVQRLQRRLLPHMPPPPVAADVRSVAAVARTGSLTTMQAVVAAVAHASPQGCISVYSELPVRHGGWLRLGAPRIYYPTSHGPLSWRSSSSCCRLPAVCGMRTRHSRE